MNDNYICAHLYGDGSRDCRLRAEYIVEVGGKRVCVRVDECREI